MISKSFPIQAFVALLTIASSLTSPVIAVNAAAAVPGPFSRNLRRDSVPASVTARFIEERQIDGQTTSICNLNAYDYFCLIDQESANECIDTVIPQDVIHCISLLCPNSSVKVINCVITPPRNGITNDPGLEKIKNPFPNQ
ncbi:hypothetical protein BGY98DRAFT_943484 [Russula aff. rugulosa BPL654]|nr:hypothetical protein BGY98DRAFT_943484 [Russula aff. rugulosa BPL654]